MYTEEVYGSEAASHRLSIIGHVCIIKLFRLANYSRQYHILSIKSNKYSFLSTQLNNKYMCVHQRKHNPRCGPVKYLKSVILSLRRLCELTNWVSNA